MINWESFPLKENPLRGIISIGVILFCGYFVWSVTKDPVMTLTTGIIMLITVKNGLLKTSYKIENGEIFASRTGGGFQKKLQDCEFCEFRQEGIYLQSREKGLRVGLLIPLGNGNPEQIEKELARWCPVKIKTR